MSRTVLVTATNYSQLCAAGKQLLMANGFSIAENTLGRPMTFQELSIAVQGVDAVVAGVDAWNEEVFRLAPNLRVIARFGVGVDNIDLEQAKRRGIKVVNVPAGNANAVAELTIGLLLASVRNIPLLHASARQGEWNRKTGLELAGRTVGLLGFGNIAQMVAKKLGGFDVRLVAYDKYPNLEKAEQYGVKMTTMEKVLRTSDVVSMHLPSLPETRGLMNGDKFGLMKRSAYFINTARGALVDEAALYEALSMGRISGAAIDVYEREPATADNPLFRLDNIVTTPHTAAETDETYHRVGLATAQAIIDVFSGKEPASRIV